MNERAANALIDAAMKGTPQVKRVFYDGRGGMCAMGVLHAEVPGHDASSLCCPIYPTVQEHYGITIDEAQTIMDRNDLDGWDFLTIARKLGPHGDA